ncbi:MAG: DUF3784 domain-containing protein [Clostridia bacterium]|nr:DUF3784 domain-containing protein [Clostridia bacterium]
MTMTGAVVVGLVGGLLLVLGLLLWKKQRVSLLHEYHYDKVTEKNQKAFCAFSGWGIISIGIGLLVTAVLLAFFLSLWCFLPFAVGLVIGLALLLWAGIKYNR